MAVALVVLLVALGALAAGVLIGRYYVPDDRQLRRTAKHSRAYMRALSALITRDHDTVVDELRTVVEENVEDVEPYFALGALFRSRGEFERAIRVHQALAVRERDKRKLKQRALYELALDFRGAGMPRRATRALEQVLLEEPDHESALRVLAALYEEQSRFNEAADLWARLGKQRDEDTSDREHHLLVAAGQLALGREDLDSARQLLRTAGKHGDTAHYLTAMAELAAARGNHAEAKDRLRQALLADPALAPHLVPGLVAAETALAGDARPATSSRELAAGDSQRLLAASADEPGTAVDPALANISLIGNVTPGATVAERVIALLGEVEVQTGPRLELALARAQLVPAGAEAERAVVANELVVRFPDALAARVAAARLASAGGDGAEVKAALDLLVAEHGALAWTMRGRWQCAQCGHHPAAFSWRCSQCRRWAALRIETGIEPPPKPARERRAAPRSTRPEGLLGAPPAHALPAPTLDPGLSADELAQAGTRRSLLDRVGGWFRRT